MRWLSSFVRPKATSVLLAACMVACKDAGGDPLTVIITQETKSALEVEARLPSPPRLAEDANAEASMQVALDRWTASWEKAPELGRGDRALTYDEVAAPLSAALGREGLTRCLSTVEGAMDAAGALSAETLTVIGDNLRLAKEQHSAGVAALENGRDAEALEHALHAADLLREVGPEGVTRLLVARADRELARRAEGRKTDELPEAEARSQRLLRGAKLALEEGDFVKAIERAFYAVQALGLNPIAP
jgi:hypothetical protein